MSSSAFTQHSNLVPAFRAKVPRLLEPRGDVRLESGETRTDDKAQCSTDTTRERQNQLLVQGQQIAIAPRRGECLDSHLRPPQPLLLDPCLAPPIAERTVNPLRSISQLTQGRRVVFVCGLAFVGRRSLDGAGSGRCCRLDAVRGFIHVVSGSLINQGESRLSGDPSISRSRPPFLCLRKRNWASNTAWASFVLAHSTKLHTAPLM